MRQSGTIIHNKLLIPMLIVFNSLLHYFIFIFNCDCSYALSFNSGKKECVVSNQPNKILFISHACKLLLVLSILYE